MTKFKASNDIRSEQLVILLTVQKEALAGWDRSCQPARKQVKRRKEQASTGDDGKHRPAEIEATTTEEAQAGDPRFLDVVVRTSEKIVRLAEKSGPLTERDEDEDQADAIYLRLDRA